MQLTIVVASVLASCLVLANPDGADHGGRGGGSGGKGGFGGHGGHGHGGGYGHGHGGFFRGHHGPGRLFGPMSSPFIMPPPPYHSPFYPAPFNPFVTPGIIPHSPLLPQGIPMMQEGPMVRQIPMMQDDFMMQDGMQQGPMMQQGGNEFVQRRFVAQGGDAMQQEAGQGGVGAEASARVFVSGGSSGAPRQFVAQGPSMENRSSGGVVVSGSRRLNQGTEGLQIQVDGQAQEPQPAPPMPQPPSQPMDLAPPISNGKQLTVKGISRKNESYSENKSGSKSSQVEYEKVKTMQNI